MKKLLILTLLLFVTGIITNSLKAQYSFNDALKLAKEENKKILIDFYTDWCGWCKKMDKDVYGNSKVIDIIDDSFIKVKLDAESSEKVKFNGKEITLSDLALNWQVSGYPTTVFLEPDGKIISFKYNNESMSIIPGYFSAKDFLKILKFIRDEKYKDTDLSTII
jgi:thioredoxin-related protein